MSKIVILKILISVFLPVLTVAGISSYFMDQVYGRRDQYRQEVFLLLWAIFVSGYVLIISRNRNPIWMTLFGFTSIQIISCFYKPYKNKLVYTTFFYLYLVILDALSLPIVSLIFGMGKKQVGYSDAFTLCLPLVSSGLMIVTIRWIVRYINRNQFKKGRWNIHAVFFFTVFIEIALIIYSIFLSENALVSQEVLFVILILFLVFDLLGIYLYHILQVEEQLHQQLALSRQKDELEYLYLQRLQKQQERSRKILHDMKNHILAIEGLSMDENGEASEYVKQVIESIDKTSFRFQTNSKIITTLVNSKMEQTEKNKILFRAEVQDLGFDFISDLDWVIILGNILDNAIEACQQVKEGERKIELFIHQYKKMLVIRLENSMGEKLDFQNGKIRSHKKEHLGIGLSNVQETVKKYGGDFETEFNDTQFKTRIVIPVGEKIGHLPSTK